MYKSFYPLVFLSIIFFPSLLIAQAVQPCIVKQYNQKETKTPLAGVLVEVRGAGTEVSDAQGALTLNFTTLKPGDRVTMRSVTKSGYEVFNTSAVEQWTISRDRTPFQIVLVKSEYMAQLKRSLRETSTENYKVKYEQAKRELKAEKEAGRLKDEEYRQQMEALEDQYDNALKDLDNYIDQFAHFDLNEVGAEEQRILEMVQQGQINEAVEAYEALNLNEKLLQERADLKKLEEAATRIEEEKARKEENIAQLKEALDREITTLKLAGGIDNYAKIGRMLKEQALADTTDYEAVKKYAEFVTLQRDYSDAIKYYQICLRHVGDDVERAWILSSLGWSYECVYDYEKAEQCHLEELNIFISVYEQNPDTINLSGVVHAQMNLGRVYRNLRDTVKAKQYLELALENNKTLLIQSSHYRSLYAACLINMAEYYVVTKDYSQAKDCFKEAFEYFSILHQQNSDEFYIGWTISMKGLAYCYYLLHDYSNAEQLYLKSLEEFRIRSYQNPRTDLPGLISIQKLLGVFYNNVGDYSKSCEFYNDALSNYLILSQFGTDSLKYCFSIADLQIDVGGCCWRNKDYSNTLQYFHSALKNFNRIIQHDTVKCYPRIALVQKGLAACYHDAGDFPSSEQWYLVALESYIQLLKRDTSDVFNRKQVAEIQKALGDIYSTNQDLAKAETYYLAALENKLILLQQDTNTYCLDVTNLELYLGRIYKNNSSYGKAERYYLAALGHVEWLFHQDTNYRAGMALMQQELGELYATNSELDKAELYYQAALENKLILMQQDTTAYLENVANLELTMGQMYAYTQNHEKSEAYYVSALEHCTLLYAKDSTNYKIGMAIILNGLSYAYAYNKKFPQALSTIEKAIALMPNEPNYYDSKGEILLMSGDEQGALTMWRKVLELDPEFLMHLEENESESELYKQLKEKGLVK